MSEAAGERDATHTRVAKAPRRAGAAALVRKLWEFCVVLRDDGLSYPDYVEQLTYLLFLKMADEQVDGPVPAELGWQSFAQLPADEMRAQYVRVLAELGRRSGLLGMIFRDAANKIRDPEKLRLLVAHHIGRVGWTGLSADVKGDAYEGLLEKNAQDTKSGAGQYFTPRPLIDAIVSCVSPQPGEVVCDPACGTGGFLLSAFAHVRSRHALTRDQSEHLVRHAIRGVELVDEVARLAAMNALLHGIGGETDDELPIRCADSLSAPPAARVHVVLTNPPFGVKGSVRYAEADGRGLGRDARMATRAALRPDFWADTANKQLNFLQHVYTLLRDGGRAAVVVPDNVLYEQGPAVAVRRRLLETCDVHTLLRLPTGLFYAGGVRANVLFFDRPQPGAAGADVRRLHVYDLRTDRRFTLKTNPLGDADLEHFVACYDRARRGDDPVASADGVVRWWPVGVEHLLADPAANLDLWFDGTDGAPPVAVPGDARARLDAITAAIAADLQQALEHIRRAAAGTSG